MQIKLDDLRRYAVARTLFAPTTLTAAIKRLGFVQADPIRAPARAQDLTLRHRVLGYRAGDLERRYPKLAVEEAFFVNYGFLPRTVHALMRRRTDANAQCINRSADAAVSAAHALAHWSADKQVKAAAVLAFVQKRGVAHPREVDAHFDHGRVTNGFGGTSSASTQLLDGLHRAGMLRIAARVCGVRTYAVAEPGKPSAALIEPAAQASEALTPEQAMDALVDVIVGKYAPLPEASLRELVNHLRGGVPHWAHLRAGAFQRAKKRLGSATVGDTVWFWPTGESPSAKRFNASGPDGEHGGVKLLAPFDPLVWDRRRFELLWGWAYRFEAYTPAHKRVRGYYALPLLWRGHIIGWGNVAVTNGDLSADIGYVKGNPPTGRAFRDALGEELASMRLFLG